MKIELETLVVLVVICAAVFIAGYQSLAIGLFAIIMLITMLGGMGKKKHSAEEAVVHGLRVQGANVLEPIVIETTRGPPFRIPAKMDLRIKPNWSGFARYEKISNKFIGKALRLGYATLRGQIKPGMGVSDDNK